MQSQLAGTNLTHPDPEYLFSSDITDAISELNWTLSLGVHRLAKSLLQLSSTSIPSRSGEAGVCSPLWMVCGVRVVTQVFSEISCSGSGSESLLWFWSGSH